MTTTTAFTPWDLQWEPQHIQRFWDWLAAHPAHANNYFTRQVGQAIVDEVKQHIPIEGVVVDMGAGPGYLLEKLVQPRARVLAIDTSPQSMHASAARLAGNPQFLGAQVSPFDAVPLRENVADVVLLIETIEHLGEDVADRIIGELYRVLKPGGHVVVTTPNEENLAAHQIMCPNCGCVYHTVQHMRSFTAASLARTMEAHGFVTTISKPLIFSLYGRAMRPLHRLRYQLSKRTYPHLLYIGSKGRAAGN